MFCHHSFRPFSPDFLIGMHVTLDKKPAKTAILTKYKTENGKKEGVDKLRNSSTREFNDNCQ